MLLGFKPRFVEPILIGTKVFTMRNKRKVEPKIGETLYMYTGLRTSHTKKITDKEKLMSIQTAHVSIEVNPSKFSLVVKVDGRTLTEDEITDFVVYDGFEDREDFIKYWCASSTGKKFTYKKCYSIAGELSLFHWTDLKY